MSEPTADGFLGGRLTVLQLSGGGHRSGLDAVLLGASAPAGSAATVVDLGAGVGVAGLVAAARCPASRVVLVEIDPAAADLARRSIALNAAEVGDRVDVVVADVTAPAAKLEASGLRADIADHVILNPPFHPADRTRPSPDAGRAAAHRIAPDDLDRWLRAAARLCRPRGRITVIYRADELPRLIAAIATRFGGLVALPVHPRADAPAHRVVVTARPQSRAPFVLLPPLVLHRPDGGFTPAADAILRGGELPLGQEPLPRAYPDAISD
ncbi:MAG TPA: methyltransferase [Methylomirabilota bacterium]|nr:methyltransferase [Methylomirabilota bacterium]